MGKSFRTFDTWSFYVLTSHPNFERLFGRRADKKRKLYNGRIECYLYQFFGPRPPRLETTED
jgi:putative N6-adenine-specific DNA methylase